MSTYIPLNWLAIASAGLFVFSKFASSRATSRVVPNRFPCLWVLFLVFSAATWLPAEAALWILALTSFGALREYFSLADIQLGDRFGILGAYLSIPLLTYFIQSDSYHLFIASIPVIAFLVIPFLVVVGNRDGKGSIVSIGIIDFGLLFLVFGVGHIGFLLSSSAMTALALVLSVAVSETVIDLFGTRDGVLEKYALCAPISVLLFVGFGAWTGFPIVHCGTLGALVPLSVLMGNRILGAVEQDLGVTFGNNEPGLGRVIHSLGPYLFPAPLVYHYLRFVLDMGV